MNSSEISSSRAGQTEASRETQPSSSAGVGERSWTFEDKSAWDEGPWHQEPDKVQWIDPATGLDCLIHRGPSGALCGYVGVPPDHKYHGVDYGEVYCWDEESESSSPEVHGGLTFSDSCAETVNENGRGICHIPEPGRPADVWWLGFDCAHSGDLCPKYDRAYEYGTYRDLDYVKREVTSLAAQLARENANASANDSGT